VPESRGKRGLVGTILEYQGEAGENDINGGKKTDGCADNLCDLVVDGKKKFDQAGKKEEDCHVQQKRDILNDHANSKFLDAKEKERANSDAMYWGLRIPDVFEASADPLLHERSKEAARETDAEAEEPKDIHANSITSGGEGEWVNRRKGHGTSIGDPNKFPRNLLKKPRGHLAGIRLEQLVTFDEERGNRRGEYTRLETIFQS
jgi:hypothetical protein